MDVLYQSQDILELRPRQWRIFLLIGISFVSAGLIVFYFFGQTISLDCTREDTRYPRCFVTLSLLNIKLKEQRIDALIESRIIESRDSDDDITYKIILETNQGNVPLTSYYSSGYESKARFVEDLNALLDVNTEQSFSLTYDSPGPLIMPIIFTVLGLQLVIFGFMGRENIWQINKIDRLMTHKRRTFLGLKIDQYSLDDIVDVTVASSQDSDGDSTFRISFTTNSGEYIPMTSWFTSGYSRKAEAAALITEFLGK